MLLHIKYMLLLFIFLALTQQGFGQKMSIRDIDTKKTKLYKLPIKVKCKFKNGTTQKLILESMVKDSLHFRQYHNQPNYDCKIGDLKAIRINRTLNPARDFAVVYGYTITLAFSAFLVAGLISNDDLFIAIGVATVPIFFTSTFVFQKITKNTYTIGDYEFMGH